MGDNFLHFCSKTSISSDKLQTIAAGIGGKCDEETKNLIRAVFRRLKNNTLPQA